MNKIVLKGPPWLMSPLGLSEGRGRVGATVAINGNTWKVPRGEEADVPAFVVDHMRECGFTVQEKGA